MTELSSIVRFGAFLALLSTPAVWAHGGQYRGPGGGGGVPVPTTPGAGGGGPMTGGRGTAPTTKWQFWWEFNKDPYLNLKKAVHAATAITGSDEFYMGGGRRLAGVDTLAPRDEDIVDRILPALKRALDATDQRDIVSSCLVAMAKIGRDHPDFKILDAMRPHLASHDQEVRETAALAMGISQMPAAAAALIALATDRPEGRKLCGRSQVDDRTRAFACYGLGLIAHGSDQQYVKRRCAETLLAVLGGAEPAGRDVSIAAINAIRLLRPLVGTRDGDRMRSEALDALWSYYGKKTGPGEQQVQAHVPPAIAQLLGRGGDEGGQYKDAFARELAGETGPRNIVIYQSAAIALGVLAEPSEVRAADKKYSDALLTYYRHGKDEQTRYFCLMSLGAIGGDGNRGQLLKIFAGGSKALAKPWGAIALGVLAFHESAATGAVDETIGRALHGELMELKNPETQAAIAVGLGLCRYSAAIDDLEQLLEDNKHREELAGYLCIGLALMGSKSSMEVIRPIVRTSVRRPDLLKQAAIALGLLGDKSVTDLLRDMLAEPNKNVAKLGAVSSALGFIGDRRTIEPLIAMLEDREITDLSRAFAAVALGGVADKEPLRWNSKIAVDINYNATVETLTNGVSGVLDIL